MCILVCFYVELLRLPLTRAAHLRAAPVVAASRTENLRLALSPASKACVWTPRHRRVVRTLTPYFETAWTLLSSVCSLYKAGEPVQVASTRSDSCTYHPLS